MPKFLIEAYTDVYLRYVSECADEDAARERGIVSFRESVLDNMPDRDISVEVTEMNDDVPEGDA